MGDFDGAVQTMNRQWIFGPYIDDALSGPHHVSADYHALQQGMRITLDLVAIHVGAGIAFIRIADDEFLLGLCFRQELPLVAGEIAGAASSSQFCRLDLLDDCVGLSIDQSLIKRLIAPDRDVFLYVIRIDQAAITQHDLLLTFHFMARTLVVRRCSCSCDPARGRTGSAPIGNLALYHRPDTSCGGHTPRMPRLRSGWKRIIVLVLLIGLYALMGWRAHDKQTRNILQDEQNDTWQKLDMQIYAAPSNDPWQSIAKVTNNGSFDVGSYSIDCGINRMTIHRGGQQVVFDRSASKVITSGDGLESGQDATSGLCLAAVLGTLAVGDRTIDCADIELILMYHLKAQPELSKTKGRRFLYLPSTGWNPQAVNNHDPMCPLN